MTFRLIASTIYLIQTKRVKVMSITTNKKIVQLTLS